MTTSNLIQPDQLPATIRSYLTAHDAGDVDTAVRAFTPSAVIVDNGETFRGTEEIRRFVAEAGAEYTYTSTLVSAERTDDAHWVAVKHLEGNFPGGVVDLRYRFVMDGDAIAELDIAP